ncbi:unnamed protein product [Heterobilharzia americana]|nr:unnamed protein product [Heterobilharzia americana]
MNQPLINPPFRNSLRMIKSNRRNRYSSGIITNKANDLYSLTNSNMSNNVQRNTLPDDTELFLANNVLSCAQERLSELQNQVLNYHASNVKLSKQLTYIKARQKEISCKLEERHRSEILESQQTRQQQNERIQDIKNKLLQEYKRSESLVTQFHNLNISITCTSSNESLNTVQNNYNNNDSCINTTFSVENSMHNCDPKTVVIATAHPAEDDINSNVFNKQIVSNRIIPESNSGQEIIQLRKQKLIIYEIYQDHYQHILKKLMTYQKTLTEQMCGVCEHEHVGNPHRIFPHPIRLSHIIFSIKTMNHN